MKRNLRILGEIAKMVLDLIVAEWAASVSEALDRKEVA
jgi:hypothetical protein